MKNNKVYIDNNFLVQPIIGKNTYGVNCKPKKIIKESSSQKVFFNVMPDKHVNENVKIKEYRLWDNAVESIFDRTYQTDMLNSPDHLTFLSCLINLQKMVYVFMHDYLSMKYDKNGKELLKVWPGKLKIEMPKMILKKENINHLMLVESIEKIKMNRYKVTANTNVNNIITISGEALIVVL